jgi:putative DNA primase/helicase
MNFHREAPGNSFDWPDRDRLHLRLSGSDLLDLLSTTIDQYVAVAPHANTAIVLWTVATHCLDVDLPRKQVPKSWFQRYDRVAAARVAPILCFASPEKRCGKTTALALLQRLVRRPLSAANITPAALFRVMDEREPTMLIDEADSFLRNSSELRNILNSGHSRDLAYVVRATLNGPRKFSTWGCKAIALIGQLPDTLNDRSIIIEMRRKLPQERLRQMRDARTSRFENLARACVGFARDHARELKAARPAFPNGLHDRARDNWEFLFSIADVAGGDWPGKARAAAVALTRAVGYLNSEMIGLLEAIRRAFAESGANRLRTEQLLRWLAQDGRASITDHRLAASLRPFGIRPRTVRFGNETAKGYRLHHFTDTFNRYLLPERVTP